MMVKKKARQFTGSGIEQSFGIASPRGQFIQFWEPEIRTNSKICRSVFGGQFTSTSLALLCKCLIINGAGEGNRTLISGLGSPHSTTEPHPLSLRYSAASPPLFAAFLHRCLRLLPDRT